MWGSIWLLVGKSLKGLLGSIGDASRWKMSINGRRKGIITDVSIGSAGLRFVFLEDDRERKLEVKTVLSDTDIDVYSDGEQVPDSTFVFSTRRQPFLGKPVIIVFEFKELFLEGEKKRYRFDYPR